jgi:hypothetical protein
MPARFTQEVKKRSDACEAGSPAAVGRSFEPDENSTKAPEELNKPLELHARDTLEWDLWPSCVRARPVGLVM